jgi:hypothetical protein
MKAPSFVTNHELDLFLGGGAAGQRQRLRLQKSGLLPAPMNIGRVKRFNIAVFPRFALAGLVRELATIPRATDEMAKVAASVFASPTFEELREALRETARGLDTWDFDYLVRGVADHAPDAVGEWALTVAEAEHELADRFNILLATETGVITKTIGDAHLVALDGGGVEQVPSLRVVAVAEKGRAVALERVRVKAQELDYVMPLETTPDKQDLELAAWFAEMRAPATTTEIVVEDESHHDPLPFRRRSAPRTARWHGASTMARVPTAG